MTTADYDAQDRLTRYGATTYGYTAAGELSTAVTGGATTRYTYDALGNLLKVVRASGDSVEYVVDGLNRRVGRKVNGAWTRRWLYADGLRPVAELDSAGAVVARYVYATRSHVPDYVVRGDTTWRLITDQLGSVRALVDVATGQVVERVDYDAWGVPKSGAEPGSTTLGYAGGLRDTLTGLVRFGARDYDPSVGRWTCKEERDVDSDVLNSYAYCYDAPLSLIDVTGATPEGAQTGAVWGAVAGAIVGGVLGGGAGGVGGTLVAPGVGTLGGGSAGALEGSMLGAGYGATVGALLGDAISNVMQRGGHHANERESTREPHEKGEARLKRDRGGEKKDSGCRPPRKRPDKWKGPWPARGGEK